MKKGKRNSTSSRRGRGRLEVSVETAQMLGVKLPKEGGEYFSPNQVGDMLKVTGEAVKQWIYNRRLTAVKLGNGYWKIRKEDLVTFLDNRNNYGKRTILLIVNPGSAYVKMIEDMGHEPLLVANAADAIIKANNIVPSLIVIDIGLAQFRPWELAAKIRLTKALKGCPILLVAQRWQEADTEKAVEIKAEGAIGIDEDSSLFGKEVERILGVK